MGADRGMCRRHGKTAVCSECTQARPTVAPTPIPAAASLRNPDIGLSRATGLRSCAIRHYLSRGPNTRSSPLACGGPIAPRRSRRLHRQFVAGPQHPLLAARLRGPIAPRRSRRLHRQFVAGPQHPLLAARLRGPHCPAPLAAFAPAICRGAPTPAPRRSLAGAPLPRAARGVCTGNLSRGPQPRSSPLACGGPIAPRRSRRLSRGSNRHPAPLLAARGYRDSTRSNNRSRRSARSSQV